MATKYLDRNFTAGIANATLWSAVATAVPGLESSGTSSFQDSTGGGEGEEDEVYFYPTLKQPIHMIVIYSVAYSVVFLLGIVGNCLVVSLIYRNPRMHTVTNYFIVNLAIADILVCLMCLPITLLSNLFSGWRFGAVMCKATPFLQGVAVSASVNTLTAIALDRYLAICHTMELRLTRRMARFMIVCVWLMATAIMAPWVVYYEQRDRSSRLQTLYICNQYWPSPQQERWYFLGAIFLTCYTIPLVFISACYTMIGYRVVNRNAPGIANSSEVIQRSKVKVLKMLIVVVILFAFSWLPLYAITIRGYFGPALDTESLEFHLLIQIIQPVSQWLGSSNSCVNPIIYCFFSKKFRRGFKDMMQCCHRSSPVYFNRQDTSATYRSVGDGNGHTMYTSIRSSVTASETTKTSRDFKDEVTFV